MKTLLSLLLVAAAIINSTQRSAVVAVDFKYETDPYIKGEEKPSCQKFDITIHLHI